MNNALTELKELYPDIRLVLSNGSYYYRIVVRWPGFEPGLPAWQADVLDQTRRPPHD